VGAFGVWRLAFGVSRSVGQVVEDGVVNLFCVSVAQLLL
jgi:hypothetical protein